MHRIDNLTKSLRSHAGSRRGVAPLEMVLCLPTLVFVFAVLMYVGSFMVRQAEVVADARNQAWHKRHTEARSDEYDFRGTSGRVEASSTRHLQFAAIFDAFPDPSSRHVVLGDAWHARDDGISSAAAARHRELNDHWNSSLQLQLARRGGSDKVHEAQGAVENLKNAGASLRSSLQSGIDNLFGADLLEIGGAVKQIGDAKQQALEESKHQLEQQKGVLQSESEKLKGEIETLTVEITGLQMRVDQIDTRLKKADNAQTKEDELSKEMREELVKERDAITNQTLPTKRREHGSKEAELNGIQRLLNSLYS